MPDAKPSKKQCTEQAQVWKNRAAMARQQGNAELEKQALDRAKQYEDKIAKIQEFELDD